ncbi:hypothetical protein P3342_012107 [Pyrenophora teres f. teres]|uniref:Uncharacterized protein n=1 Tax=Pyrenophora teres f. teres TaxID=97479 RepID=A0A6S6WEF9_9PLEO|nr:hypothetical protein HRS9139_09333 [Pyrenophora teres f. teres]KAE8827354.1 hypothetical protein PTNB85_08707 [Pyrenophora teres f. teres]KAE8831350.1 hypothetical protein HRS9122_08940 [Pyrenophora teres f. teres]KAE8855208.1 hypothetical protein PTNB29_09459 [Pyrenophora teres f. teres]KAE8857862.1 hypothetical protein PTNB73_09110 [Pyrenophora teres f. teres]
MAPRTAAVAAPKRLPDVSGDTIAKATKPEWRTDPTKPIGLSDQRQVPFARDIQWLYCKTLNDYKSENHDLEELARMYVLGEAVMDAMFQEVVIKTIIHLYSDNQETMSLSMIRIIYEGTPGGSPARQLVADICAFQLKPRFKRVKNLDTEKDSEFMKDLIVALLTHRQVGKDTSGPWIDDPDHYSVLKAEGSITEEFPIKDETDMS